MGRFTGSDPLLQACAIIASRYRLSAKGVGALARRKLVAGNWKMNGSLAALAELDGIAAAAVAAPGLDVAIAVPATLIMAAAARVPGLAIGAEDVHPAGNGAHTGCVSAGMVKDVGGRFSIVGHS